jgi:DNA-binding NarL/FixJ family response regulator
MEKVVLRVWLVDAQDAIRQPLAGLLNREPGVECLRNYSSAKALLPALQELPPDVILLDAQMPGMSGVEAVRRIKALAPATIVLMLTTFADSDSRKQLLAAGASDYLFKYISPGEIIAAIRSAKRSQDSVPQPIPEC